MIHLSFKSDPHLIKMFNDRAALIKKFKYTKKADKLFKKQIKEFKDQNYQDFERPL